MTMRALRIIPFVFLALLQSSKGLSPSSLGAGSGDGRRLAPCQICRTVVTSFEKGVERTKNGHYTGGDAAWEEDNKKSYFNSELRLTEIQEGLCSELSVAKDQCHEISSNNEELLEEWWQAHFPDGQDLFSFLCIEKLKACCPEGHYGAECKPCLKGENGKVCSGQGKCKGSGTRKGNGDCSCYAGFAGQLCNQCASLFYPVTKEDGNTSCNACHNSCEDGCKGPGAKNCDKCKKGWEWSAEQGCVDKNECLAERRPCKRGEFCQNMEGSYSCIACDTSCESCYGDGPDMCDSCKEGYNMKDNVCVDVTNLDKRSQMSTTRYLTYSGMTLVTLVVFQKNAVIASFVGVVLGLYVACTEYLLRTGDLKWG